MMPRWLTILAVVLFIALAGFAQQPSSSSPDSDINASTDSQNAAVHFGDNIVVRQEDAMRDAVCFFCSVDARGSVHDVVVFFGNTRLAGQANDVVVFGGNVRLGPDASTDDIVLMGGRLFAESGSTVRGDRVIFPPVILLIPLLVLALAIYLIVILLRYLFTRDKRRVVYVAPRT